MGASSAVCVSADISKDHFDFIKSLLYDAAGINIPDHKQQMVFNRISKRIQNLGIGSLDQYIDFLNHEKNGDEIIHLINALTTNVTNFFREEHHYDHLKNELKNLCDAGQKKIRIWSAACSIGAEPYSAAIIAHEALSTISGYDLRILATDIDTNALQKAREGSYPERLLKGLSKPYQKKYFIPGPKADDAIVVKPSIRNMVSFNYMNFNDTEWPMSGPFDFIFCRNALIYFDRQKQQEYVEKFIQLIRPGGFLYLGHSENSVVAGKSLTICGPTIYKKETV